MKDSIHKSNGIEDDKNDAMKIAEYCRECISWIDNWDILEEGERGDREKDLVQIALDFSISERDRNNKLWRKYQKMDYELVFPLAMVEKLQQFKTTFEIRLRIRECFEKII